MVRLTETRPAQPSPAMVESPQAEERKGLPRRDYFILPLLSLFTLALLFGMSEGICRLIWPEQVEDPCIIYAPTGTSYRPNCISRTKFAEGPWIENKYNECGYRTMDSCRAKPPGAFRIAVLGSSVVSGWGVPYEDTFVAQGSRTLSEQCARKIEIQNISTNNNILSVYRRSGEALALNPDLVVLLLGAGDTHGKYDAADLANRDNPVFQPASSTATLPFLRRVGAFFVRNSRAMLIAKHFLYRDPSLTLKAVIVHPMDVDYMVTPEPEPWKKRLADLDLLVGDMADKFRARGIPFVLLPTVNHPQALLLSSYPKLEGFDPREFERNVSAIAQAHGITALNVYDDFTQPRSDLLFFSGDGHPTAEGHSVLSRGMARELVSTGKIPGCPSAAVQGSSGSAPAVR